MPYCSNCRTYIPDGTDTCPNCGNKDPRYTNVNHTTTSMPQDDHNNSGAVKNSVDFKKIIEKITYTEDKTNDYDSRDISSNINNAVFAYLGVLVIIPLIKSRQSKFAMFHCGQGLINSIFSTLYMSIMILIGIFIEPGILSSLINLVWMIFSPTFTILMIIGIINAIRGRAKTLPIFGRINLMKLLYKNS